MGLLKGIATAVLEKTRDEVKEYLAKLMEEEKKKDKTKLEDNEEIAATEPVEEVEVEPTEVFEEEEVEEEEEIIPINDKDIERLTYKSKPDRIMISYDLADLSLALPLEEFALYIKMVIYSQDQKKNYGYLGNSLKKKLGLADMDIEEFDALAGRLQAYGLLEIETVSDNQRTYILYLPFDDELMKRTNASKVKQQNTQKRQPQQRSDQNRKKEKNRQESNHRQESNNQQESKPGHQERQQEEIPGQATADMKDEDLYKSYRTFVHLEIDRAKMRVGRSNFDKIYMEAVKYIDKKYGFKVLSDSEKFKEHLSNYYISAFDIIGFDEWKKRKV
jgi:hypothetical protein